MRVGKAYFWFIALATSYPIILRESGTKCDRLKIVFLKLKYPKHLFNLAVKKFVDSKVADQQHIPSTDTTTPPSELSYHSKIRSLLM